MANLYFISNAGVLQYQILIQMKLASTHVERCILKYNNLKMWQFCHGLCRGKKIRKTLFFLFVALAIVGVVRSLNRCGSWTSKSMYHTSNHLPADLSKQLRARIPYVNEESSREPFQHRTTLITTRTCEHHHFLLILVSSAPPNVERRDYIRSTWAVDKSNILKPRWKTVFLVAQTQIQNNSKLLMKENEVHADLIRADYYDHYWNQTLKLLMGFEWAARYCNFSFLLKTDDDVFVNFPKLIFYLNESTTPNEKVYMGNMIRSPCASRQGKWEIYTEEYSEETYPDYCSGFGFILSHDVVAMFVEVFDVVPNFRIDDVYIGILAHKTGIKAMHNDGFVPSCLSNTALADTLVRHGTLEYCGDSLTTKI